MFITSSPAPAGRFPTARPAPPLPPTTRGALSPRAALCSVPRPGQRARGRQRWRQRAGPPRHGVRHEGLSAERAAGGKQRGLSPAWVASLLPRGSPGPWGPAQPAPRSSGRGPSRGPARPGPAAGGAREPAGRIAGTAGAPAASSGRRGSRTGDSSEPERGGAEIPAREPRMRPLTPASA